MDSARNVENDESGYITFAFKGKEIGVVALRSKSDAVVPLSRPTTTREIAAVFCPSVFSFSLINRNLFGRFTLAHNKKFEISNFEIRPLETEDESPPISANLLTKDFFDSLIAIAIKTATTQAMWYPPNSKIDGPGKSSAKAGKDGFIKIIPKKPSGGAGKSRKQHTRLWNDFKEIQLTVKFMNIAEATLKAPVYPKLGIDLSTKAKREQWVAKTTGIWSVGTVHVQLAMARKIGLIKPGRKTK